MGLSDQAGESKRTLKNPEPVFFFLFFIIACLLYSDALRSYFNSDDFLHIYEGKSHPLSEFYRHFTHTDQGIYRPFVLFLYSIEYTIYGFHPPGYHITALLFYWLSVVSVYYLALLLLPNKRFAFLSSLLFLFHPIHNEPVAWISSKFYQVSGLFYILALIFFINYTNRSSHRRLHYGLSLGFFTLGLFSLESAVTLPLIVLVYSLLYKRKDWEGSTRIKTLRDVLPFFLLAGLFPVIRAYAIGSTYYEYGFNWKIIIRTVVSFILGLFAPSNALLRYLRVFVVEPIASNKEISQFYTWGALICAMIATLILGLALLNKKFLKESSHRTFLVFTVAWVAITIMPYYLLFYRERFVFLPSIAFCLLLGLAIHYLLVTYKTTPIKYAMLCLLVSALLINWSVLTKSKVIVWRHAGEIVESVIRAVQKEYTSFPSGSTIFLLIYQAISNRFACLLSTPILKRPCV